MAVNSRRAAIVSYHDLRDYFAGNTWSFQIQDDGSISAKSKSFDVKLKQKSTKYDVSITATDDPSDTESTVTEDPVKFITKFLSTGTEADDLLKKLSFVADMRFVSTLLRRAALMSEVSPGATSRVKRMLRRGIVAAYGPGLDRLLVAVVRAVAGEGDDAREVEKITKDMKAKGWKVTQDEDEKGRSVLKVDVSGIYEAEIRAKDTTWDYSFQVQDFEESKEEGSTDDPIKAFRTYYRKDSTDNFKQLLKQKRSQDEDVDPDATAAPGKGPKKPAKKVETGPPDEGTDKTVMAPTALPPSGKTHNIPHANKWSE